MRQPETKAVAVASFEQYLTVGEGKYSYWLWDLYQARLATPSGKFVDYQQSVPLLLELRYLRDITKTEFVDATVDQWGIQAGAVQKQHKLWAGELTTLWRDVKKGDMLSAELHADGLISFYFNQQLLGKTKDPNLGPAFFDIWLSEKTTAPELRQLLLKLP
ncbi:hypothetical protein EOE67_06210 [Rheinheimera riviphila]|uniref:Chalcone isomerase domain-containing protein n=2 Tax=Rheinheimera riviphila TaxID=1834037 RepID=A0A437R1J1_9GAMM|nr:hypothetical protein EOE67_06210 [Rheinheimera riviphila]